MLRLNNLIGFGARRAVASGANAVVWALVCGGAGRGGSGLGDGGNGGGVLENTALSAPPGTYIMTPGIGGTVGGAANGTACSIGALLSASGGTAGLSNVYPSLGRLSLAGTGAGTGVNGVTSNISGANVVYGSAGAGGKIYNRHFEGDDILGPAGGAGGGTGGDYPSDATANRGGGGAGGVRDHNMGGGFYNGPGTNGANGTPIVRFPTAEIARHSHTNGTVTTSGSDTIITWYVVGTWTVT
jgi:hypothetical protein